jgi:DNA (cytosine-5)-methyltransferase 1
MGLRYLSVCSGIEAATVAWHPLGWTPAAFSEIEAFPRAVLAHHYQDVPCHGDFTTIGADEYGPIGLLVGGTPCQSFSIAGLRGGLADDRGNLALEYLRLADRKRPRWLVWENVPGVLSSNGGRDFGAILGGMAELGYGFAYRILDAQHFGVPQRRRRVFVVGYLGDWRRAAAVLFERHSLSGHPAPRREARTGITPILEAGARTGVSTTDPRAGIGIGADGDAMFTLQAGKQHAIASTGNVAHCLNAGGMGRQDYETETLIAHSLRGEGFDASEDGTGRGTPLVPVNYQVSGNCGAWPTGDVAALDTGTDRTSQVICFSSKDHGADAMEDCSLTLRAGGHSASHANAGVMPAVAFDMRGREGGAQFEGPHDTVNIRAASGGSSRSYVAASAVRRLTPEECEALQGFPRGYTLIPYRGKTAADGPRYKALGNSMAVPVMAWIGQRIDLVERLSSTLTEAAA